MLEPWCTLEHSNSVSEKHRNIPTFFRTLLDRPFSLEDLEITVYHVEVDLPAARPGIWQQLHLPLVAFDGALGVELEPQSQILLPDLQRNQSVRPLEQSRAARHLLDKLVGREERRNVVEAGEGLVLVEEAALGESGDESGQALVVGERGPDGLERRADPHPRVHQPAVLLPRQLPHLHLEPVPLIPVLLHLPVHIFSLIAGDTGADSE